MGLLKGINHIRLATKYPHELSRYFIDSFKFIQTNCQNDIQLKSKNSRILVDKNSENSIDSVYDIALNVSDIPEIINRAEHYNVNIISKPNKYEDDKGYVIVAQIKSIVGNVIHTIIDSTFYKGHFLPHSNTQFVDSTEPIGSSQESDQFVEKFDHITYAVHKGQSDSIVKWYSDMFDMNRIPVNNEEDISTGFMITHLDKGMILKAFDYWKCAKEGVEDKRGVCKFIIAEELNEHVPNQIGTFLLEHEGAGVQHIGLMVNDILSASQQSVKGGAKFLTPPQRYYENISRNSKITNLGVPIHALSQYGILIDVEPASIHNNFVNNNYLMQIFTNPIFDRNTFFLELIERQGAYGFGAGNIKALWDAVDINLSSSTSIRTSS